MLILSDSILENVFAVHFWVRWGPRHTPWSWKAILLLQFWAGVCSLCKAQCLSTASWLIMIALARITQSNWSKLAFRSYHACSTNSPLQPLVVGECSSIHELLLILVDRIWWKIQMTNTLISRGFCKLWRLWNPQYSRLSQCGHALTLLIFRRTRSTKTFGESRIGALFSRFKIRSMGFALRFLCLLQYVRAHWIIACGAAQGLHKERGGDEALPQKYSKAMVLFIQWHSDLCIRKG